MRCRVLALAGHRECDGSPTSLRTRLMFRGVRDHCFAACGITQRGPVSRVELCVRAGCCTSREFLGAGYRWWQAAGCALFSAAVADIGTRRLRAIIYKEPHLCITHAFVHQFFVATEKVLLQVIDCYLYGVLGIACDLS